ncbi:hypothetical protein ABIE65_002023 [Constrictibacter sp. MBR-5]|uniref:hypothetical protein n=1 Tax=Constrictibacter sp. MBR-5 TaxID=3156467 RepID=UPI003397C616
MAKAPASSQPMLAGFKLVTEAKPIGNAAVQKDPIANFKGGIDKQLEFVELELAGKPLPMTNKGRKVRLAYFRKGGVWYITLKYGNTNLLIDGRGTVEAGPTLENVKQAFEAIRNAADNELREPITEAADAIGARLKGRTGRKKAA